MRDSWKLFCIIWKVKKIKKQKHRDRDRKQKQTTNRLQYGRELRICVRFENIKINAKMLYECEGQWKYINSIKCDKWKENTEEGENGKNTVKNRRALNY